MDKVPPNNHFEANFTLETGDNQLMFVLVVDKNRKPLNPCHPARARKFLKEGKAVVLRRYPFTIMLKNVEEDCDNQQEYRLKLDPGSRTTGISILKDNTIIWAAELNHRGYSIKQSLESRRALRRGRRNRHTRYRKPRFNNRNRADGWLAPSLQHRVDTTLTWVNRLRRFCPITAISMELVNFDTQLIQNPEISGIEYQQGELAGYEVRQYLLTKWGRQCVYCGIEGVSLQVEHIHPKSKGGSNRVSNLTLSCVKCNQRKGNKPIEQFLSRKPDLLKKVLSLGKCPLKDAAAVNSTRWTLYRALSETGLPVETGTGGRTKFNRTRQELPKTHWLDAACVGQSTPDKLQVLIDKPLIITATGHGTRKVCRTDKYGFPVRYVPRSKFVHGFQTGDIVKAIVTKGKKIGTYMGRIAVRTTGSFNIATPNGLVQGISHKYCSRVQGKDGYQYTFSRKSCRTAVYVRGRIPPHT
ncbi:HNH endonuclease domain protein [Coleofasciculus chthonoplastes PCC 7420]|uniref:HNH endonuclease domain protein n=2 Tax=Coleofasciculaceae TaxID=1892251 RepID=B4VXW1_9CYAN|nr:HNH endonuclease domain protein [Coleofasciculus chthonoplastes PCC 7420]